MTVKAQLSPADADLVQLLFGDTAQVSYEPTLSGAGVRFEVNNLSAGAEPMHGDIVATGEAKSAKRTERRTHYLVRLAGQLASFRICAAAPDSSYQAFATGQLMEDTPENEAKVRRSIEALCDC